MIFQFFNLLDDLTVADNVLLPAQLAGMRRSQARARVRELLAALHIERHRDAYPGRLSGGERQRVAIARALVNRPVVLLADEPTGALDTATGEEIGQLLLELNRSGQTLVMVTHNPELAARYTHRAVHLLDGRIAGRTGDRPPDHPRGRGAAMSPGAVAPRGARRDRPPALGPDDRHRLGAGRLHRLLGARPCPRRGLPRHVRSRVLGAARRASRGRRSTPHARHAAQLAATARLPQVTAAAGPFARRT